ncbi:MAG: hypothetical protein ACOX7C_00200 [Brevefilum sp.]
MRLETLTERPESLDCLIQRTYTGQVLPPTVTFDPCLPYHFSILRV